MQTLDRRMIKQLILDLAKQYCVEPAAASAVLSVEASGGRGLSDGRPVIRLEVHKFWASCSHGLRGMVDEVFRVRGPRPWEGHEVKLAGGWTSMHRPGEKGQYSEWLAFDLAREIDDSSAIESTSVGCAQILGIHWALLGYESPAAFLLAQFSEENQLMDFFRFMESQGLLQTLRERDWESFARIYNGPGNVEMYANRLSAAHAGEEKS